MDTPEDGKPPEAGEYRRYRLKTAEDNYSGQTRLAGYEFRARRASWSPKVVLVSDKGERFFADNAKEVPQAGASEAAPVMGNLEAVHHTEEVPDTLPTDMVNLPPHYAAFAIEPIRFLVENGLDFMRGNVIKYVMRAPAKNGVEDYKKARRYLDMLIAKEEGDPDWWKAESSPRRGATKDLADFAAARAAALQESGPQYVYASQLVGQEPEDAAR